MTGGAAWAVTPARGSGRCCCPGCSSSTSPTPATWSRTTTVNWSPSSSASSPKPSEAPATCTLSASTRLCSAPGWAAVYALFTAAVTERGARELRCITSPGNAASIGFHTRLGFRIQPGDGPVHGVPVHSDHDGPGLHRVVFTRLIGDRSQTPL